MTPCHPRNPLQQCTRCARYRPDMPHLPESRPHVVCIDATVLGRRFCPMWVAIPTANARS